MRVLGIDPGIERLGYAVLELDGSDIKTMAYGLVSTDSKTPKPLRLKQIYDDLNQIYEKWKPERIAIETLIFAKNVKTALIVSEVRGVLLLFGAERNCRIHEFTPLQVKMAVTGYGKAGKQQVQTAVKLLLSLPEIPKPDDVADALAIALCGIVSRREDDL